MSRKKYVLLKSKIIAQGKLVNQRHLIKDPKPLRKQLRESSNSADTPTTVKKQEMDTTEYHVLKDKEKEKSKESILIENDEGGRFELNNLMTRVVEDELQSIMIKVWQALPDEPPSEAERFVAERLRNEVSDEIRNVLGLNVTKRLLDVFNPLFVKIRFSIWPESSHLDDFLEAYNIKSFKCINAETNTFAARFSAIGDFDNICAAKNIQCGNAKLTIIPCYKFTQCPSKLNTIFVNKPENKDKPEIDETAISKTSNTTSKINLLNEKVAANQENKPKASLISSEKTSQAFSVKKGDCNKSKELSQISTDSNIRSEYDKTKESFQNNILSKVNVENKFESDKNKQVKQIEAQNKMNIRIEEPPKVTQAKSSVVDKDSKKTDVSPQKISKDLVKNVENKASNIIDAQPKASIPAVVKQKPQKLSKPVAVIGKRDIKVSNLEPRKVSGFNLSKNNVAKYSAKYDEDEEMNDEEILALISEGVIVDECSGSEEE